MHIMYRIFIVIAVAIAAFSATSCTKVIDIELKDADRVYVIEGGVYEGQDSVVVRVTQTTSFFDTSGPSGVNDATVLLTMPDGSVHTLDHLGDGIYMTDGLTITTESTYSLQVNVADRVFTASSYMQASVPLDSLEYEFQPPMFGGDAGYNVFLVFQDEIGKNFYRIISTVNDTLLNEPSDLLAVDDNLNDGNLIRIPVFTHLYEPGDTVEAELQSINEELYTFYTTFASVASEDAGSPFSAAPANPETNIIGGAMGVFGAYTSSKRTIILPE